MEGMAPERGQRGLQLPRRETLSPVGEKLTIRRGIFTDERIYVLYKLWAVVIDLAKNSYLNNYYQFGLL